MPKVDLDTWNAQTMCFGCGPDNPIGLKMKFNWDAESQTAATDFTPGPNLQGWPGKVHGGLTACLLDEAVGQASMFAGLNTVTARLNVRFRKMIEIGQKIHIYCKIIKRTSRLLETEAGITDMEGNVLAEATSTQFIVGSRKDSPDND